MAILWQRKLFFHEYLNILLSIFSTFCPESDNVPTEKSIQGLGGNLIGNQISPAHKPWTFVVPKNLWRPPEQRQPPWFFFWSNFSTFSPESGTGKEFYDSLGIKFD